VIYISGDSFCAERTEATDWPLRLANNLNMPLRGKGFPGRGWWPVRLALLDYINAPGFNQTEYFVFCHTSPSRILHPYLSISPNTERIRDFNTNLLLPPGRVKTIKHVYYNYLYDEGVQRWAMSSWFKELNELLKNKKVFHICCLNDSFEESSVLQGNVFDIPLNTWCMETSNPGIVERARTTGIFEQPKITSDWDSWTNNHMTTQRNVELADELTEKIKSIKLND
jgi:hypothetical protein